MLWKAMTCSILATLPFQFPAMPSSPTSSEIQNHYHAPLRHSGGAGPIVPGYYSVFLFPGHSIEEHSAAIKTDITQYIMFVFDKLYTDRVVYSARGIDDDLLAAIRSDRGGGVRRPGS
ncbi:hypothetical protein BKA61DRAFT_611155 [Leptodontidium sp. MPI-SDFR-AT-0119]|nr:hypothetical protein BKA61DRAFT_611155 [Leptodontidium sp. MPI-SDFR-AT-0119]